MSRFLQYSMILFLVQALSMGAEELVPVSKGTAYLAERAKMLARDDVEELAIKMRIAARSLRFRKQNPSMHIQLSALEGSSESTPYGGRDDASIWLRTVAGKVTDPRDRSAVIAEALLFEFFDFGAPATGREDSADLRNRYRGYLYQLVSAINGTSTESEDDIDALNLLLAKDSTMDTGAIVVGQLLHKSSSPSSVLGSMLRRANYVVRERLARELVKTLPMTRGIDAEEEERDRPKYCRLLENRYDVFVSIFSAQVKAEHMEVAVLLAKALDSNLESILGFVAALQTNRSRACISAISTQALEKGNRSLQDLAAKMKAKVEQYRPDGSRAYREAETPPPPVFIEGSK